MSGATFWNYCKWNSATSGSASFTVGAAAIGDIAGSHDVPENCEVVDGKTYKYYAQSADGSQYEWGRGAYNATTHTLARDTVVLNSDGTTTPVIFTTNPIVDLFPSPQRSVESFNFPSGTLMLFQQSNAPVGWTKQTAHNDKALRVVSGAAGAGGSNSFSSVMAQTAVAGTALSVEQMPTHHHNYTTRVGGGSAIYSDATVANSDGVAVGATTADSGSGSPHTHALMMNIQYVDLIIAKKS